MGLNVPMKTTGAYDTNSIINKFGTGNAVNKKTAITTNDLIRNPQISCKNTNNQVQRSNNIQTTSQVSSPQPVRRRPKPSGNGIKLQRGQKIKLSDGTSNTNLKFYFGWDIKNPECDLDGSAFMLDSTNKVLDDNWFIFYGTPESPDNSVHYRAYDEGDGAEMSINTSKIYQNVQKIVMSVTIYEAFQRNLNFGMVSNVYVSIADGLKNIEIAHFDITECFSNITALVIGELYRHNNEWKFSAVGSGVNKDLAEFCGMYGVNLI